MSIPNSEIIDMELKGSILYVKFRNGETIKFIDVKDWEYNQIISSNDWRKSLLHFAKRKPHASDFSSSSLP